MSDEVVQGFFVLPALFLKTPMPVLRLFLKYNIYRVFQSHGIFSRLTAPYSEVR